MPEIYDGKCSYQKRAQPYLEAIALGIRDSAACRAFLLKGTAFEVSYNEAVPLWEEQWLTRDPKNNMRCPFWSNYWYDACSGCDCRIELSVSMEIDELFLLRSADGKRLALHVEMKRDFEPLSLGQAEAYRPRALCFRDQRRFRKGLFAHDDSATVLFYGTGTNRSKVEPFFDRLISHDDAKGVFPGYP